MVFKGVNSPYLVQSEGGVTVSELSTQPPEGQGGKKQNKSPLKGLVSELRELQHVLYADDRYSVLLIFQAMDAAGKDSTIRRVLTGVNPAGFQVFSLKSPVLRNWIMTFCGEQASVCLSAAG